LNLTAFACAVAASLLLGHRGPALLSAIAILCWLVLARRMALAHRRLLLPHREPAAERSPDRQVRPS
jgi:hypothetical protein